MSLYSILEIKNDASCDEIKTAYYIAAKKYHPDVNINSQKMVDINKSYEILSDVKKRHEYDMSRHENMEKTKMFEYFTDLKINPENMINAFLHILKPLQKIIEYNDVVTNKEYLLEDLYHGLISPVIYGCEQYIPVITDILNGQTILRKNGCIITINYKILYDDAMFKLSGKNIIMYHELTVEDLNKPVVVDIFGEHITLPVGDGKYIPLKYILKDGGYCKGSKLIIKLCIIKI